MSFWKWFPKKKNLFYLINNSYEKKWEEEKEEKFSILIRFSFS